MQTNNEPRAGPEPFANSRPLEADIGQGVSAPVTGQRKRNQRNDYFAHLAEPIFVVQLDGRIIDANPAAYELLGYHRHQLLSMFAWEIIKSCSRHVVLQWLQELEPGTPANVPCVCHHRSGEQLELDLHLSRFESSGHDFVIVSCRDNTEISRLEEKLRASERQLAEGEKLSRTGSWILDLETGRLKGSAGFYRIFGFPEATLSLHHSDLAQRLHPQHQEFFERLLSDSGSTNEAILQQFEITLPDGTSKQVESTSRAAYEENGFLTQRTGTVMDVTDRSEAVAKLRAAEQLARGHMQTLTRTMDAMANESGLDQLPGHVISAIVEQLDAHSISVWQSEDSDGPVEAWYSVDREQSKTNEPAFHEVSPQENHMWQMMSRAPKIVIFEDFSQEPKASTTAHTDVRKEGTAKIARISNFRRISHDLETMRAIREQLMAPGAVSAISIPLLIEGQLVGCMGVRFRKKRTFQDDELELIEALAQQVTLAVQVAQLSKHSRKVAIELERNRIARDMHDTLGQSFTGVLVQLAAAEDALREEMRNEANEHIARACDMARFGLTEARRSVYGLRPEALNNGLCKALDEMMHRMTHHTTMQAELMVFGLPNAMPPAWEEHLLHIFQEVLTNTLRHAGASHFSTFIHFETAQIKIKLWDNGCGVDLSVARQGYGIRGIEERVAQMGGDLLMDSAPEQGLTFLVALPNDATAIGSRGNRQDEHTT